MDHHGATRSCSGRTAAVGWTRQSWSSNVEDNIALPVVTRLGRQDKRPTVASAYRIGRAEEFPRDRSRACCRRNENVQGFQSLECRLSSGDVARNIDILDLSPPSDSKLHLGDAEIPLSSQPYAPDRRRPFYLAFLTQALHAARQSPGVHWTAPSDGLAATRIGWPGRGREDERGAWMAGLELPERSGRFAPPERWVCQQSCQPRSILGHAGEEAGLQSRGGMWRATSMASWRMRRTMITLSPAGRKNRTCRPRPLTWSERRPGAMSSRAFELSAIGPPVRDASAPTSMSRYRRAWAAPNLSTLQARIERKSRSATSASCTSQPAIDQGATPPITPSPTAFR